MLLLRSLLCLSVRASRSCHTPSIIIPSSRYAHLSKHFPKCIIYLRLCGSKWCGGKRRSDQPPPATSVKPSTQETPSTLYGCHEKAYRHRRTANATPRLEDRFSLATTSRTSLRCHQATNPIGDLNSSRYLSPTRNRAYSLTERMTVQTRRANSISYPSKSE